MSIIPFIKKKKLKSLLNQNPADLVDNILTEDGFNFLTEDGDFILLEAA